MARIAESEQSAKEIVERARAEAQRYLQEHDTALAQEVAEIRRECEQKCQAEFRKTLEKANAELENVEAEAARRVPELAKAVMALFMPESKDNPR